MHDNNPNNGVVNEIYALPTSYAQQRLWFLHRLEPNSPAYNIPAAFRLNGPVDVAALERSFQEIVGRHEALRTTFSFLDGEPKQIIAPTAPSMSIVDLRSLRESERESKLRRRLGTETKWCFDLEKGPLFRVSLFEINDEESVLLINMHHIISDGWSIPILFREIATCYEAYSHNRVVALPELPIQYADYAIWQRDSLQGDNLKAQLSFWRKHLEGLPALKLPIDRPRPAVQSYRGAKHSVTLSSTIGAQLKMLSRQEGVTLFMSVLAAFQAFLYRYTGQDDISVGTPIAGRTRRETEGLIGFFVNTLVLRTDLSGDPTFRELLARVRKVALDAYEHQDVPFEKLVKEFNPDRSLSQTPLFQVMFAFHDASESRLRLHGLAVTRLELPSEMAKFDLSAYVTEKENSLTLSFFYKTDLFDALTVRRWLSHFQALFEAMVGNPDQKLTQLSFLSDAEKHQLLVEWNDTKGDYPRDSSIHHLFEAQVMRTPDAVAMVLDEQQLTYAELNQRANRLARYLRDAGVGSNELVGICVERSLEMTIGLLAILKAGGVYVPLDPSYPKERLSFMLEDTRASILITQERLLSRLPKRNARIVCLDRDWPQILRQSESNLGVEISAENLAYVIYTSGSTGKPKGVAVSHRAVNRLVMNTDYVELSPADVVAQASNISFDAATFEIWGALLNGARLVLISKGSLLSPQAIATTIERCGITTLFLTTALFNQMAERIPAALGKLHHLLFGGEAADPRRVRELLQKSPPKRLLHVYGPTETTTFASWYLVKKVTEDASTVPIGRPIANTKIYILDSHLRLVPIGVIGELYIGGDGLATGYLNHPELTQAKFVDDTFSCAPGGRLYKTGDLARYLADGNIEFVGRIDEQVKIRGFRIEPGEIEAALAQHPSLRETVVVAREDDTGNKRLIAYIVPDQPGCPNDHTLRSFLKQRLPEYMLPTHFVSLNNLPLTPSGKIDRKALPHPAQFSPQRQRVYVEPRSPTEEVLAAIWSEVLNTTRVSVHDDFFELGGHSLLAIRLLAQLREECQLELSVRQLFEAPTIAGLAAKIETTRREEGARARDKRQWSHLIEIQRGTFNEPVFIIPGGGGAEPDLLKHFRLARCMGKEFSFYGLVARGSDGISQPHASVEEMAADYLKEIRSLQPTGPYYLLGECIGGIVAYEVACQLRKQNQEVALLVMMDTFHPTWIKYLRYRYGQAIQPISTWWKRNYYAVVHNYYVRRITFHLDKLLRISWREKAHYLINKANVGFAELPNIFPKASETAENASAQVSLYSRPAQERYLRTLRRHKPKPYDGKILMVTNEELYNRNPTAGWANLALGGIDVQKVSGVHDNYIHDHIKSTAKVFKACLVRARNGR